VTRHTVVWYPFPESELLRLWLAASDKQAVTNAANAIDRELAIDPDTKGSVVRDQLRELNAPPLRVLYLVSEPDRLVKILAVALI
jgi:hypothetical protein